MAFRAKAEEFLVVQIFNLDNQQKLKSVKITGTFAYWSWVSDTIVGLVTNDSVYHLDITQGADQFTKIVDRKGNIETCQIISYKLDPQGKYASISGISSTDGGANIDGNLQLCLIDQMKQQSLQAHFGCFGKVRVHSESHESILFAYAERPKDTGANRITISEIGQPPQGAQKFKVQFDLQYPQAAGNDFPIFMGFASKFGLLYVLARSGTIFIFEVTTGSRVLASRLSDAMVITAALNTQTDGLLVLNKNGNVIQLDIDNTFIVDFIKQHCAHIPNAVEVANNLAIRNGLPGAEQYYIQKFNTFMMSGQHKEAAEVVASSPGTILRNRETIEKFKQLPKQANQPYPLIQYFFIILEKAKLNDIESLELCALVLNQNKKNFIEEWIAKDKLSYTEGLGDLLEPYDLNLAITIYEKASSGKAAAAKLKRGDPITSVIQSAGGSNVDFTQIIKDNLMSNPQNALAIAKNLCKNGNIAAGKVAELFTQANRPQELISFCVECMTENKPDDAQWQTTVLDICLKSNPSFAETIFQSGKWSQYNKQRIGPLCEQKGLYSRALECYTDIKDIKRVILNTQMLQFDFLVTYIGSLQADDGLVCLQELLRHNRQNLQLVVKVAQNNFEKLGVAPIVKMLEQIGAFDGIYFFLGSILPNSQDKDIYFKYIEAAVKCNQLKDVERVIVEAPQCYDAARVKDFLLEMKLPDPKPLIVLCDKNGFIAELAKYLMMNNFRSYIELYILRVNSNAAPEFIGNLIDLEAEESYLKQLVLAMRGNCPVAELIQNFERRNKIRILETWLEQRVAEGNSTPEIHNALAKITIDSDKNPAKFLQENRYYDAKVIGKYCEERDPHLAFEAYRRDFGKCDYELIDLSNKNALYRLQAKYLVERQEAELWAHVLAPDNPHRQSIIEQVVSNALPESKSAEEVSTAVKAFSAAELNTELISLLEKIVLHNSEFSTFKPLQNLLIITAIKTDRSRVMDYINRLDNYDGVKIANIARGEDYKLYEEAFTIYQKIGEFVEAINVLIYSIESLQRAAEFAEKVNKPEVWTILGKAYLDQYMVSEAIEAFLKSQDSTYFLEVINAAQNEEKWEDLHTYLEMARKTKKDASIDSELVFGLSKMGKLAEIEAFVAQQSSADYQKVGEKCFQNRLFEAAKILFTKIKSNARIASCLVHLKQYPQAIEAAKKATNTKTWKEVALACIAAGEFKLAAVAGQNIIIHPDHLEELSRQYELYDKPEEMIALLESSLTLERSHIGIFTELGIFYAKYRPEKLMDFIRNYFQKLNVSKLLRVCERYLLWNEAVYLHTNYDEHDNAVKIMMEHSPSAFKHDAFSNIIQKVTNNELLYKAIDFYLDEEPEHLCELLRHITSKVDLSKVVTQIRKAGYLPIIVDWLKSVQNKNNQAVNDALNQLYLEIGDFEALRESIANYESIDAIGLAKQIEGHDSPEFRRISALIYRRNKKFQESINASKTDKQYKVSKADSRTPSRPHRSRATLNWPKTC
jgi:clathrin heavy chain